MCDKTLLDLLTAIRYQVMSWILKLSRSWYVLSWHDYYLKEERLQRHIVSVLSPSEDPSLCLQTKTLEEERNFYKQRYEQIQQQVEELNLMCRRLEAENRCWKTQWNTFNPSPQLQMLEAQGSQVGIKVAVTSCPMKWTVYMSQASFWRKICIITKLSAMPRILVCKRSTSELFAKPQNVYRF